MELPVNVLKWYTHYWTPGVMPVLVKFDDYYIPFQGLFQSFPESTTFFHDFPSLEI